MKKAHLDFPLDQRVRVGIPVHAKEQESLTLLIVAVVGVQHLIP